MAGGTLQMISYGKPRSKTKNIVAPVPVKWKYKYNAYKKSKYYANSSRGPELKILDTNLGATSIDDDGYVSALSTITQGITDATRVATSIKIKYIDLRGCIEILSPSTEATVALYLIQDLRREYGVAPIPEDLLESVSSGDNSPYSYLNKHNFGRFKIMQKKLIRVTTQVPKVSFQMKGRSNVNTRWEQSTGNKLEGHIYLIGVSDTPALSNPPRLIYNARVKYQDY